MISSVCSNNVLPNNARYCFGLSACIREPTPAAGNTTTIGRSIIYSLSQCDKTLHFLLPYHAASLPVLQSIQTPLLILESPH